MRLVDADALCVHIEEEFDGVCVYDVCSDEAAREFCDMVDIAPTIDAIPVEWLAERAYDTSRAPMYRRYARMMIDEWQREQEAR